MPVKYPVNFKLYDPLFVLSVEYIETVIVFAAKAINPESKAESSLKARVYTTGQRVKQDEHEEVNAGIT
jgi:hypothetical protein